MIPNYETIVSGTYVLLDKSFGDSVKVSSSTDCKSPNLAVVILDGAHANLPGFLEMDGCPTGKTVLDWINR